MASFKLMLLLTVVVASCVLVTRANPLLRRAPRSLLMDDNYGPVEVVEVVEVPGGEYLVDTPIHLSQRRDARQNYQEEASGYAPAVVPVYGPPPKYVKGKVGPVYTFVKTDYNANFKWGVRHRVGSQYGR